MLNISNSKPQFYNYHSTAHYLKFLSDEKNEYYYLNFTNLSISIPLKKIMINSTQFDLASSVGFQSYLPDEYWNSSLNNIYSSLAEIKGAVTCYILTKNKIECDISGDLINTNTLATNYYVDLTNDEDLFITSQARDSRQRLKKVIKNLNFTYKVRKISSDFIHHYERISINKNFPSHYQFTNQQFKEIDLCDDIYYLELTGEGFLAGGIFAIDGTNIDYLFGANNPAIPDTIRLLIWQASIFFKRKGFKKLFLGGGISKKDSLDNFKSRLGTKIQHCSALKIILDPETATELTKDGSATNWFSGYFPPYRNR